MKDLSKYLNKFKFTAISLGVFFIFFLLALTFIDFKNNSNKEIVSVIGISEEKILKDAQFSLDYVIYGTSEEDLKKKLDDKINELKNLITNFDQIKSGEIEKSLLSECVVNSKYYYQAKVIEEGKCLSNNWKGQSRIKFSIKGDQYSEEIKKNILNLAPKIVNSTSGPIFIKKPLDKNFEDILIKKAITNAREKAENIASESKKELGDVIRVDENPFIKDNLMSLQGEEKEFLAPWESVIQKKILVDFELE